jgi:hypothetical protein
MHGSGGSRGLFVHLLAGAALGAVVVLMVWIFSGGRPFGEVVGSSDVSSPTTASVKQTDVQRRTAEPAGAGAQLESEPPDLGTRSKGGDALRFRKEKVARPAKAKAEAKAKRTAAKAKARSRARRRQVVRVVAPPSDDSAEAVTPVAAVPSPAPTGTPAPIAAPPKPPKPRTPTFVAGAGEG